MKYLRCLKVFCFIFQQEPLGVSSVLTIQGLLSRGYLHYVKSSLTQSVSYLLQDDSTEDELTRGQETEGLRQPDQSDEVMTVRCSYIATLLYELHAATSLLGFMHSCPAIATLASYPGPSHTEGKFPLVWEGPGYEAIATPPLLCNRSQNQCPNSYHAEKAKSFLWLMRRCQICR